MKNEQYLNIIQNLVNTNTKENLQERWLKIVREFEDYNITFIQNTAKIFLMDLVNLQIDIKRQDYSKQDVFEKCIKNRKSYKEVFNKEEDLEKIFEAFTIHFAVYCKEEPQDVKNVFGITN